ncbi:MAG: deoxyribodipyrimidine photolyase [Syntrophobacteraceae bacterium]
MNIFPEERIRLLNQAPIHPDADFVLYWMIAFRRVRWNFSLERAVEWACDLGKPLVVLEALSSDYPWASERLHHFILEGMQNNRSDFKDLPVSYFPYVEKSKGEGRGLVRELAARSCIVVTDDYPCFFLPQMIEAVGKSLPVRMEAIDSNGLLPLVVADKVFLTAFSFRRYLQKQLPRFLDRFPGESPLSGVHLPMLQELPVDIANRWPVADTLLDSPRESVRSLPLDHAVTPVETKGGSRAAGKRLESFLQTGISRYHMDRNLPVDGATSGLSPYLHFGHLSAHEIFRELSRGERWSPEKLSARISGKREGWWGMSPAAEAFLDQLVTWRELGFNLCSRRQDYDLFNSLPDWAVETLTDHENDSRPYLYPLEELEFAKTHDPLWNAAQRQLLLEGRIYGYPRMLWGKKIVEWTASPRQALDIMIELNNKYALDGRDPNSYSGILWVLGRYDRPFGPARPVLGKIRYMSSQRTVKKIGADAYMRQMEAAWTRSGRH